MHTVYYVAKRAFKRTTKSWDKHYRFKKNNSIMLLMIKSFTRWTRINNPKQRRIFDGSLEVFASALRTKTKNKKRRR